MIFFINKKNEIKLNPAQETANTQQLTFQMEKKQKRFNFILP